MIKFYKTLESLLITILFIGFTISCSNSGTQQPDKATVKQPDGTGKSVATADKKTRDQMTSVYSKYKEVKDALYNNDAELTRTKVTEMKLSLDTKSIGELSPSDIDLWNTAAFGIRKYLDSMESSKNIKDQRLYFGELSEAVAQAIKAFHVNEKEIYLQHCPMAKNGKGADWLSSSEKIDNPFYGKDDEMKRCGEVKEKILE